MTYTTPAVLLLFSAWWIAQRRPRFAPDIRSVCLITTCPFAELVCLFRSFWWQKTNWVNHLVVSAINATVLQVFTGSLNCLKSVEISFWQISLFDIQKSELLLASENRYFAISPTNNVSTNEKKCIEIVPSKNSSLVTALTWEIIAR